jgi:glyoxylase-like metal-dependent hydrolase (beta-lactamase superfamily II)/8-oxo-dGTP pyrophosphatase MutT (NUDIX family)
MTFAGDVFVFPGGRVDAADADDTLGTSPYAVAAIREAFEEAGVLLGQRRDGGAPDQAAVAGARRALITGETTFAAIARALDLRIRTDLLAHISHWTTPPVMPRRFDTRFFVAELPPGVEPSFDTEEVVDHRWMTARAALEAMAAGDIALWVPTSATLQQLSYATGLAEIQQRIVPGDVPAPRIVGERPGLTRVVVGSAGAVPGQTVNCYLVGLGDVIVVDPGDPSDEAADAILGSVTAAGGRLVGIALTHADPDHAAGAEALALRLELPILGGPGAGRELPYLVREVADGERVGAGRVELEVVATPGPRPDSIAFALRHGKAAADDRPVVLVGDLVGGRADRSILGPPDEPAWTASLERIRALRPGRLFPGHGEPLDELQ